MPASFIFTDIGRSRATGDPLAEACGETHQGFGRALVFGTLALRRRFFGAGAVAIHSARLFRRAGQPGDARRTDRKPVAVAVAVAAGRQRSPAAPTRIPHCRCQRRNRMATDPSRAGRAGRAGGRPSLIAWPHRADRGRRGVERSPRGRSRRLLDGRPLVSRARLLDPVHAVPQFVSPSAVCRCCWPGCSSWAGGRLRWACCRSSWARRAWR